MRMIFEIRDLKYATPATVSRAGILYISTVEGQQWHSLIASWVSGSGYSEEVKTQLSGLFELYVPRAVQLLSTQMKTSVECEPTTAVSALLQVILEQNAFSIHFSMDGALLASLVSLDNIVCNRASGRISCGVVPTSAH